MSESVIAELRELSKAHADGRMRRDQYRLRRAQLLDALVGIETRVVAADATRPRQPPAPVPPSTPAAIATAPAVAVETLAAASDAVTAAPAAAAQVTVPVSPRSRSAWPWAAVGIVIVGAAGIYMWRSSSNPPAEAASQPAVTDLPATVPEAEAALPAPEPEAVVTGFLQRNDWSDSAVSAMNSSWWSFSDEQVVRLMAQPSMQQLRAGVTTQLQGHLKKVRGGAAPLDPSAPLILLARNLSVQVPEQVVLSFAPPPPVAATVPAAAATAPAAAAAAPPATRQNVPQTAPVRPPAVAASRPSAGSTGTPAPPVRTPPATPASPAAAVLPAPASAAPAVVAAAATPAQPADPCAEYFTNLRKRFCSDTMQGGETGPPLAIVPAGSFQMGSSANAEEQPAHTVVIATAVAVTVGEIDVGIYRRFCTQTSRSCDLNGQTNDAMPVAYVSWADANDFAAWLSRVTGQRYRLPSEAEWEYFARASTKGDYWSDAPFNPGQAIYTSESSKPAGPVAARGSSIETNKWSIRHIAGNLREWTADGWSDNYGGAAGDGSPRAAAGAERVVRGGSFKDPLSKLRSAARTRLAAGTRDAMTGFRLVRELRQ